MSWPPDPARPGRLFGDGRGVEIAATRLLDLDDGEPELPAENSGRGGATLRPVVAAVV